MNLSHFILFYTVYIDTKIEMVTLWPMFNFHYLSSFHL